MQAYQVHVKKVSQTFLFIIVSDTEFGWVVSIRDNPLYEIYQQQQKWVEKMKKSSIRSSLSGGKTNLNL